MHQVSGRPRPSLAAGAGAAMPGLALVWFTLRVVDAGAQRAAASNGDSRRAS
jgi:hypothetical protein